MGRYRKIDTRIWNDAKFTALTDRGKLCFLFLLTHPHLTALGAMRATLPGLASELNWGEAAFKKAFDEVLKLQLVEHEERASFIGLPNFLRYNQPESPNVVKSWADALDLIPECRSKDRLLNRAASFAAAVGEAFAEALPEAFRKGMPNQEPEPEQEQEPEPETKNGAVAAPVQIPEPLASCPEFLDAWERWLAYRKNKRLSWLDVSKIAKLAEMAQWGAAAAVKSINNSIGNGWQGLFHPGEKRNAGRDNANGTRPGDPGRGSL